MTQGFLVVLRNLIKEYMSYSMNKTGVRRVLSICC